MLPCCDGEIKLYIKHACGHILHSLVAESTMLQVQRITPDFNQSLPEFVNVVDTLCLIRTHCSMTPQILQATY